MLICYLCIREGSNFYIGMRLRLSPKTMDG